MRLVMFSIKKIISIIFLVLSIGWYISQVYIAYTAVPVYATILSKEKCPHGRGGDIYFAHYTYQDYQGFTHTGKGQLDQEEYRALKVDDTFIVYFIPDKPNVSVTAYLIRAVNSPWLHIFFIIFVLILGILSFDRHS